MSYILFINYLVAAASAVYNAWNGEYQERIPEWDTLHQQRPAERLAPSTEDRVLIDVSNWERVLVRLNLSWRSLLDMVLPIPLLSPAPEVNPYSVAVGSDDLDSQELQDLNFRVMRFERVPVTAVVRPESELVDMILHAYLRTCIQFPVPLGSVTIHLLSGDGNNHNPFGHNLPDLVYQAALAGYRIQVVGMQPGRGFTRVAQHFADGRVTVLQAGYSTQAGPRMLDTWVRNMRARMAVHALPLPRHVMDVCTVENPLLPTISHPRSMLVD